MKTRGSRGIGKVSPNWFFDKGSMQNLFELLAFFLYIIPTFHYAHPKPNPEKPEKNKNYHENTEVRRHENLNVFLFRAFNLSCFAACALGRGVIVF
jgi:hypothetical protein